MRGVGKILQVKVKIRRLLGLLTGAAVGLCCSAAAQVPSAAVQLPAGNQELHILVGRSVVVRTSPRLTRVLVGNPAVVSTSTTSPTEVVLTATAAGSSSVVL